MMEATAQVLAGHAVGRLGVAPTATTHTRLRWRTSPHWANALARGERWGSPNFELMGRGLRFQAFLQARNGQRPPAPAPL